MWAYSPEVAADYWDMQVTDPNPNPNPSPSPSPNPNLDPNPNRGLLGHAGERVQAAGGANPNPNPNPSLNPNQVSGYKRQAVRNISTDLAQAQPEDRLLISGTASMVIAFVI